MNCWMSFNSKFFSVENGSKRFQNENKILFNFKFDSLELQLRCNWCGLEIRKGELNEKRISIRIPQFFVILNEKKKKLKKMPNISVWLQNKVQRFEWWLFVAHSWAIGIWWFTECCANRRKILCTCGWCIPSWIFATASHCRR